MRLSGDTITSEEILTRIINPIRQDFYDYQKYKAKINQFFVEEMKKCSGIPGFDRSHPRRLFWQIVDETWDGRSDYYACFTFYLAYFINSFILREMGQITEATFNLEGAWWNYLHDKIFQPYFIQFSETLVTKFLFAYPDSPEMVTTYHELLQREPDKSWNLFIAGEFEPYWIVFKEEFDGFYSIFERFSLDIGRELAILEHKSVPQTIPDVYQLYAGADNRGPRTPVGYQFDISGLVNVLRHIRNALAHRHYSYAEVNPKNVIMQDFDRGGKLTWEQTFAVPELYDLVYDLLILVRGFERAALYFEFIRHATLSINQHTISLSCPYCRSTNQYIVLNSHKKVKCKLCRKTFKP